MSKRTALLLAAALSAACMAGCRKQLAQADFLRRYEEDCVVTAERGGYRISMMYLSPEYMAARNAGADAKAEEIAALAREYGRAHYVRISIRPVDAVVPGLPEAPIGGDPLLPQAALGARLRAAGDLSRHIRLMGPRGEILETRSAIFQGGIRTGAGNVILAAFPAGAGGPAGDPGEWELVIEDLGLNLGTVREKLSLPKGFRLKVAA